MDTKGQMRPSENSTPNEPQRCRISDSQLHFGTVWDASFSLNAQILVISWQCQLSWFFMPNMGVTIPYYTILSMGTIPADVRSISFTQHQRGGHRSKCLGRTYSLHLLHPKPGKVPHLRCVGVLVFGFRSRFVGIYWYTLLGTCLAPRNGMGVGTLSSCAALRLDFSHL